MKMKINWPALLLATIALALGFQLQASAQISFCYMRTAAWQRQRDIDGKVDSRTVVNYTTTSWSIVSIEFYYNSDGSSRGYIQYAGVYNAINYYGSRAWWCTNAVRIIALDGNTITNALPPIWTPSAPVYGDKGRLVIVDGETPYVSTTINSSVNYLAYSGNTSTWAEQWLFCYMFADGTSAGPQYATARWAQTVTFSPRFMGGQPWLYCVMSGTGPFPVQSPPERSEKIGFPSTTTQ